MEKVLLISHGTREFGYLSCYRVIYLFLFWLSCYFVYCFRKEVTMEMVNMHEKQLFMDGKKFVAIISEAG